MRLDRKRLRKLLGTSGAIVCGNCMMAVAVAAFIIPRDIITGGATGGGIVLSRFLPVEAAVLILAWTENPMLAALFGGGIIGISLGMVMRAGSSTGGTDVINLVLHKWFHLPVSVMLYATDIVLIGGQALLSDAEPLLYGIVLLVVESFVLDRVLLQGQSQIQVFVVSVRYDEIRHRIYLQGLRHDRRRAGELHPYAVHLLLQAVL